MCTLAVYHKHFERVPLVIAANRDEFYGRPTIDPCLLSQSPATFGGKDLVHGGTWLAISEWGVAAALLNRRSMSPSNDQLRSRGLLCLDALRHGTAHEAMEALRSTRGDQYNPFNLLVVDSEEAWVLTNNGRQTDVLALSPGLHLISNLDVDDAECPRIATSTARFAEVGRGGSRGDAAALIPEIAPILADHGTPFDPREVGPGSGLCVHLGTYGTRSSTLLSLDDRRRWSYFQAAGPPCETTFVALELPTTFRNPAG